MSHDGIAHLETGRRSPSWDTVLAICSALGVSCEEFRQAPADAPRKGPGRPKSKADDAGAAAEPKGKGAAAPQKKPRGRKGE